MAAAAGVELTHLASLYHDDVMDEADVRRGAPSANARYGNSTAILVGDLLFGKASELVAGLGAEAVLIQARTFVRLCAGQIRDDRPARRGVDPVDYYLGVLADKTGVLIATAARYGAMFSGGADRDRRAACAPTARSSASPSSSPTTSSTSPPTPGETGKTPGTDLREGVDTLPVLLRCARPTPPTPGCTSCCAPTCATTTPCTPRRWPCCAATPPSSRPASTPVRWAPRPAALLAPLPDERGQGGPAGAGGGRRRPRRLSPGR